MSEFKKYFEIATEKEKEENSKKKKKNKFLKNKFKKETEDGEDAVETSETVMTDAQKAKEIIRMLIKERIKSKDTVERMLKAFGVSDAIQKIVLTEFSS